MNGSVVRAPGGAGRTWRMRQWPYDPSVAHLIFVDHRRVPDAFEIESAIRHARKRGARAVRTSAMFPASASPIAAAGFTTIDRLALLRLGLDDEVVAGLPSPTHRVRTLTPWQHQHAARVDREAFGPGWGNDAASLREIRRATPYHHARQIRDGRGVGGFAISGAAGDHGYLQRLAVGRAHRRRGLARDLVIDALRWMHGRGLVAAMVNTGVDNEPALLLYAGLGFERLDDELTIAELALEE